MTSCNPLSILDQSDVVALIQMEFDFFIKISRLNVSESKNQRSRDLNLNQRSRDLNIRIKYREISIENRDRETILPSKFVNCQL